MLSKLLRVSFLKTLYFNLKYFDLLTAAKLPVIVSKNIVLSRLNGSVQIEGAVKTGMIRLGFGNVGIIDVERRRGRWDVSGKITFRGTASLGHGTKLSVGPTGVLVFGKNFTVTAESQIACHDQITFGDGVLVSWDCLFMDTDFHQVKDANGTVVNPDRQIRIGNRVWFGCRCTILKGVELGDNVVVSATTSLHGGILRLEDCVIGGNPVRVLKAGTTWEM